MSKYGYKEFGVIFNLINQFNKKYGLKKRGISFSNINDWFFPGYENLMTHVETDRNIIINNKKDKKRHNKDGLYKEWSVHRIVEKLMHEFEISPEILHKEGKGFEISAHSMESIRTKYGIIKRDKDIIYLVGSTYQGKQLEVSPRSIFEINLKSKKVIFYYSKSENELKLQKIEGAITGESLLYISLSSKNSKKMYILRKGLTPWDEVSYLKGTYAGDDGDSPMAGEIFCQKVKNLEIAKTKLHNLLETGLQYQLLYSQIRVKGSSIDSKALSNHHFSIAAREIESKFKGHYYALYLSSQIFHSILVSKLELNTDGSAVFHGLHNEDGENGWIYLSGDKKKIFLRFKYSEKLNIFKYFITLSHSGNRLYGSYGGGSNFPFLPESGRIVLFKVDESLASKIQIGKVDVKDEQLLLAFVKDEQFGKFNREAINFLQGMQMPLMRNRDNDFSDSPAIIFEGTSLSRLNNLQELNRFEVREKPSNLPKAYVGVYKVYIFHCFNHHPKYRIQKIGMEFKSNGLVIATSKNRIYKGGALEYTRDRKLYFSLAYEDKEPELFHIVEYANWQDSEYTLTGTYTGTGRIGLNHPIGGRIILFKEPINTLLNQVKPIDYNLSSDSDMEKLEVEESGLLDYFLGKKDNMIESYGVFQRSGFLPITNTVYTDITNQVSGLYLSFRIRTDLKTISIVPLCIDNWGNVKMKSTQRLSHNIYKEYKGVCEITNNTILTLRYHSCGGDSLYAQSTFNKSKDIVDFKNNVLMGVFLSHNSKQDRPFACKQIVIFCEKSFNNYNGITPEIIPIPFYPNQPIERFTEINEKYNKILEYLIGVEYNIIRMSRGPRISEVEIGLGFKKKINYGDTFFLAGLMYFEMDKRKLAIFTWNQAKLNGFNNQSLIDKIKERRDEAFELFSNS